MSLEIGCTCGQTSHTIGCPFYKPLFGAGTTIPFLQLNGWTCPVCGGGNSPFTARCPCMPFPVPQSPLGGIHVGDIPLGGQVICESAPGTSTVCSSAPKA